VVRAGAGRRPRLRAAGSWLYDTSPARRPARAIHDLASDDRSEIRMPLADITEARRPATIADARRRLRAAVRQSRPSPRSRGDAAGLLFLSFLPPPPVPGGQRATHNPKPKPPPSGQRACSREGAPRAACAALGRRRTAARRPRATCQRRYERRQADSPGVALAIRSGLLSGARDDDEVASASHARRPARRASAQSRGAWCWPEASRTTPRRPALRAALTEASTSATDVRGAGGGFLGGWWGGTKTRWPALRDQLE